MCRMIISTKRIGGLAVLMMTMMVGCVMTSGEKVKEYYSLGQTLTNKWTPENAQERVRQVQISIWKDKPAGDNVDYRAPLPSIDGSNKLSSEPEFKEGTVIITEEHLSVSNEYFVNVYYGWQMNYGAIGSMGGRNYLGLRSAYPAYGAGKIYFEDISDVSVASLQEGGMRIKLLLEPNTRSENNPAVSGNKEKGKWVLWMAAPDDLNTAIGFAEAIRFLAENASLSE